MARKSSLSGCRLTGQKRTCVVMPGWLAVNATWIRARWTTHPLDCHIYSGTQLGFHRDHVRPRRAMHRPHGRSTGASRRSIKVDATLTGRIVTIVPVETAERDRWLFRDTSTGRVDWVMNGSHITMTPYAATADSRIVAAGQPPTETSYAVTSGRGRKCARMATGQASLSIWP